MVQRNIINHSEVFPLYRKYPKLEQIPRVSLIKYPTPLEKMEKISKSLGEMNIWIKRDDLTNLKYGGNKPRKYEFVFASLLNRKKKRILTVGGTGTNHGLATAILAKDFGFKTSLFLVDQPLTQPVRDHLLYDYHFGAKLYYTKNVPFTVLKLLLVYITNCWSSYFLCTGASNSLGTIGFVSAGLELALQVKNGEIPEPDKIFVVLGSRGMATGLALGIELAGLKTKIIAVAVSERKYNSRKMILRLAKRTMKRLRKVDPKIPDVSKKINDRIQIDRSYFGGEYGRWTKKGQKSLKEIKKENKIYHLDPVYTAKTFSALIDYCHENPNAKNETILFWHSKNSVDLSYIKSKVDYHDLPNAFHKLFDGTVPLDEKIF